VSGCSAGSAGGVVYAGPDSGAVSITGSNVSGCSAVYLGGVVNAWDSGAVSIIGSDVSGCSARDGGVVLASWGGAVSIIDSDVTSCSAEWGGVVYAKGSDSLFIAGVDFINNGAGGSGSVLYLQDLDQRSSINDASFTGNTAGDDKTITTNSPIDWVCRLGSWMPAEGAFKGNFRAPECYPCSAGYYGATTNLTKASCSAQCITGHFCKEGTGHPESGLLGPRRRESPWRLAA